ncbi:MAG: CDP-alcohol phosphatidyltransferase family protein [Candidatus Latescibacteria bacterium]|nr:CDP-alcohol phosphatidyltransferase family protein [Candidatus Latescibacterota bacterium]
MIRQGLLIFPDLQRGADLMSRRVAGLSLLDRMVRTMARAGVEQLAVVVPPGAPRQVGRLPRKLCVEVRFLEWGTPAPLPFPPLGEGLLVVMGGYVHHHASLSELVEEGLGEGELVVQVSAPVQRGSFIQVHLRAGEVEFAAAEGGESASSGALLCAFGLGAPEELLRGREEVWAWLSRSARGRRVQLRRTSRSLWRRVEDRRGARAAKNMLFSQVTKATSGFISRHLNARISIPTSKLLIETGISPHLVTVLLVLPAGLASAYLVTRPEQYLWLAGAGVLWQLAAILDRCDGEIARVQLSESKFGAWFDTLTDNLAYLCAYSGMLVGLRRVHPEAPYYLYLGISAIAALLLTLGIMYSYALKTGSGSLQNYLVGLARHVPEDQKGGFYRFTERYGFLAKRDTFSFIFFIAALADALEFMYWFAVVGIHLVAIGVLISQQKMLQGYQRAEGQETVPVAVPRTSSLERRP